MTSMTLAPISVQSVPSYQREQAVTTIAAAFASDPVARWAYPSAAGYFAGFPSFVRAFAGRAFVHNTAFTTGHAAALWLPPGVEPDVDALVACMQQTVPPAMQPELFGLMEEMDRLKLVLSVKEVDFAVINRQTDGCGILLSSIMPDLFIVGPDHSAVEDLPEYETCQLYSIKVVCLDSLRKDRSSSQLLRRLQDGP